jgi:regulatory protein
MDSALIFERYYNLSLRFLSYRPRSEKEIKDYLNEKKVDEEIQKKIIEKLKSYNFLNDLEFAKFWVEQRTKFKRKPIRVIEYELNQKGINKNLIEEVISGFDSKELDLENAKKLAEKKMDFHRNLDPKKREEKVMSYLLGKGFNYEIVKKALKD